MKSITSSIFGRFLGHATQVTLNRHGITITVKNKPIQIHWHSLTVPPYFMAGWLGQTLTIKTADKCYLLTKLAYRSDQHHKRVFQQYWVAAHQERLQALLTKITDFIEHRYLRDSTHHQMRSAVNKEYQRWFPWAKSSLCVQQLAASLQKLSDYQHYQQADFDDIREIYINKQLIRHRTFFESVESNPLTDSQRRACIIDDDNNLLLAGAGTGKTSVMVGRAGYLLKSQQAKHDELLLLAYGNQAAAEMDQRIQKKLATRQISATTFHRLGLDIIAQVEGRKPDLSAFALDERSKSAWVKQCFNSLIVEKPNYRKAVLAYLSEYYYTEKNEGDFACLGDYYQYLKENNIQTFKGEYVKGFPQLYIANWLFTHGIEYQYKMRYHVEHVNTQSQQIRPDFFLPEFNLYIEYFSVDEEGRPPHYIDSQQYHAIIQLKRDIHQSNQTHCIELTYENHKVGRLLSTLKHALQAFEIKAMRLPDATLLAHLTEIGRIDLLAGLLAKLLGLYKGAGLDASSEKQLIEEAQDPLQIEKALCLLTPIVARYQALLNANNEIDFEDMIIKSLHYVQSGQFSAPWRFIMVDEFQDISEPRARLVKALRNSHKGCSLFAVGDDWQAIYRFSGADVSLTTHFEQYFGATTRTELDQTFRFNNKIGQVASDFISQNPAQIHKQIHALKQVTQPAISILRKTRNSVNSQHDQISEVNNGALNEVLEAITQRIKGPKSVYLLARFWFQLPDKATLVRFNTQYPMLSIVAQTFHASKGKEADYVVIMGLSSGKQGFPSNKSNPAILEALLAKPETFEHAEERRLFYVALTRAKSRVYMIADMLGSSVFVEELIKDHEVELNEFAITVDQRVVDKISCVVCKSGTLTSRVGRHGTFYSCSHAPRCSHKEQGCNLCDSAMTHTKHQGFRTCLSPKCGNMLPICEQCGADMLLRKGRHGAFWGCRNFTGNDPLSCQNVQDKSAIIWPTPTLNKTST